MFAKSLVLSALLAAALAPAARAGSEFELRFGKRSEHGAFELRYVQDFAAPNAHGHGFKHVERPRPRVWVDGHYENRCERVWIEGCAKQVWVEPVFERRFDACGRELQVLLRPGCWQWVQTPGHFELRNVQSWVPGHWEDRPC